MPGRLNRLFGAVGMRQDGVVRIRLERPVRRLRARDRHAMSCARAALREQQVLAAVDRIQVRPLGPDAAGAAPQQLWLAEQSSRRQIELGLVCTAVLPAAVSEVERATVGRERQGGIHRELGLVDPDRIRPGTGWIARGDEEAATARYVRADHVEGAVVLADRGRKNPLRAGDASERELARPREHVPELSPVHEVTAMKDRDAREILERARHQVIVGTDATDARIRVEAGQDGVFVPDGRGGGGGRGERCRPADATEQRGKAEPGTGAPCPSAHIKPWSVSAWKRAASSRASTMLSSIEQYVHDP